MRVICTRKEESWFSSNCLRDRRTGAARLPPRTGKTALVAMQGASNLRSGSSGYSPKMPAFRRRHSIIDCSHPRQAVSAVDPEPAVPDQSNERLHSPKAARRLSASSTDPPNDGDWVVRRMAGIWALRFADPRFVLSQKRQIAARPAPASTLSKLERKKLESRLVYRAEATT